MPLHVESLVNNVKNSLSLNLEGSKVASPNEKDKEDIHKFK
jgi:hypothetical protein